MNVSWQGLFPAVCTQFKADFSLDIAATLKHVDALLAAGVDGLVMLGTVGENTSLEYAEKLEVLKRTCEHVKGRVPVLSGVAEYTTALACRYAADAAAAGADGLMVLPAMVYKSDERETLAHFKAVAGASDLPIMIYNNPVSYGVDVRPEAFGELAGERALVAIKESSEDPRRITDIRNAVGERFTLFCGVDDLVMESFVLGATGWISGLVNAFPAESRRLWDLLVAGKFEEARRLYAWFAPLLHLDTHVKLVQYIKLACAECGYGTEMTRPPRLALVGDEREKVLAIIRKAKASRP